MICSTPTYTVFDTSATISGEAMEYKAKKTIGYFLLGFGFFIKWPVQIGVWLYGLLAVVVGFFISVFDGFMAIVVAGIFCSIFSIAIYMISDHRMVFNNLDTHNICSAYNLYI